MHLNEKQHVEEAEKGREKEKGGEVRTGTSFPPLRAMLECVCVQRQKIRNIRVSRQQNNVREIHSQYRCCRQQLTQRLSQMGKS